MSSRIDTVVSTLLVIAACTVTGSYVYRTFVPAAEARSDPQIISTRMSKWSDALAIGHTIAGDSSASTTLVMFGDLECPACRDYNTTLQQAIKAHPKDLRVMYVSFPLAYHRFALPAARATECLSNHVTGSALDRWIDVVYAKQDSLGTKSWSSFASDAGIADTVGLDACARNPAEVPRIDAGLRLGRASRVRGTPTIAINGWVYSSHPTTAQIDSIVARSKGKSA